MQHSELERFVVPELDALGFECVKLEIVGSSRNPVIRLFIDKPDGVTVRDCQLVNRAIGLVLETEDPFPGKYLLEVSSPGSSRPLVTEAHFQRFIGGEAKVPVERPADDGSIEKITYTGHIRSCITGVLTLATGDGEVEIHLDHIRNAQLIHQEYKIDKKQKKEKRVRKNRQRKGDES